MHHGRIVALKHILEVLLIHVDVRQQLPIARAAAVVDVAKQKVEHLAAECGDARSEVRVLREQPEFLDQLVVRERRHVAGNLQEWTSITSSRCVRRANLVPQQAGVECDEEQRLGRVRRDLPALAGIAHDDEAWASAALVRLRKVRHAPHDEPRTPAPRHARTQYGLNADPTSS